MPQGNTLVSKDKQISIFQELISEWHVREAQYIRMACVWNAKLRCTDILLKYLEVSLYQLLELSID